MEGTQNATASNRITHGLVEQSMLKYQESKSGCSDFLGVGHLSQFNKAPKPNMSKAILALQLKNWLVSVKKVM